MAKSSTTGGSGAGMPFGDIFETMRQFKMPGLDIEAMMARERSNMEALQQANQVAFDGMQAMANRQAEMLREAMEAWQQSARDAVGSGVSPESAKQSADLARKAFEQALANMRELAEMSAKTQREAYDIVRQRFEASLAELKAGSGQK